MDITLAPLSNDEQRMASNEGWDLFEVSGADDWRDGLLMIQRCDDHGEAAGIHTDDEAMSLVVNKAREGSSLHLKALSLHCMPETMLRDHA